MQKSKIKKQNIKIFERFMIAFMVIICILLFRGTGIWANNMGGMHDQCGNNFQCSSRYFCEKGIGECAEEGICAEKQRFCEDIWDPVCACDENTYPNKCEANRRGISVDYAGLCTPGVTQCTDNSGCSPDYYCQKTSGNCSVQGTCAPRPVFCIQIWAPVCGCDGNTYPNECEAFKQGVNVDYEGECSPGVVSCTSKSGCSPDSYCQKAPNGCTGQGACAPRPTFCAQVWDPVCGCDGNTYPNKCEASSQGVNVDYNGECQPGLVTCANNNGCSPDCYCQKSFGACTAQGTCTRRTHMCPQIWEPVCGCDGSTYPNGCEAASQGVNVNYNGECQPGAKTCTKNSACPTDSYCQKTLGDCTGQGECVPAPEQCVDIWSPVCGCDGKTYSNECFVAANGINIEYVGECTPGTVSCTDSSSCTTDTYCRTTPGDCSGQGVCVTKSEVCPQIWAPMCGCNGKTYPNECEAGLKGVNVDYTGECAGTGPACIENSNCQPGKVCQKTPGKCTGQGICSAPPNSCPEIWAPVCGCDGKTYPNGCTATSRGVNIDYTGQCSGSDPNVKCMNINDCPMDSYCDKTPGDCTGEGICVPATELCLQIWDPICGCDGKTYPNECEAASLGVNIDYPGECSAAGMLCQNNMGCPSFAYCQKSLGQCTSGFGECKLLPEFCIQVNSPVCGCDGKTYSNQCVAAANGVNVKYTGECKTTQPPPGYPYGGILGGFLYGGLLGGTIYGGFAGGFTGGAIYGGFTGGAIYGGFTGGTIYGGFAGGFTGGALYGGFTGGTIYGGFAGGFTGGALYGGFTGGAIYGGFTGGFTGGAPYGGFLGGFTGGALYGGFLGGSYPYGGYPGNSFTYGGFSGTNFIYGGYRYGIF